MKRDRFSAPTGEDVIVLKALVDRADFQKKVLAIREETGLPTIGLSFDAKRSVEYDEWHKKFADLNEKARTEAGVAINELDMRFEEYRSLGAISDPIFYWREREHILSRIPENHYHSQIDLLLRDYHLPASYRQIIGWYIKYNLIRTPAHFNRRDYEIGYQFSGIEQWTGAETVDKVRGLTPVIIVRIFMPLKKARLKKLAADLRSVEKEAFPRGLLVKVRPDIKIDQMLDLARKTRGTKSSPGRPKKEADYFRDGSYANRLRGKGRSDAEIKKIIAQQKRAGERREVTKHKIEKTSSPEARKAKNRLKAFQSRRFPAEGH